MKPFSNRILIAAALATAFAGVSAAAIAQGMGGMSPDMHNPYMAQRAQHIERMEKMRTEHQTNLKAELKLTPAQEPAWHAFVARTGPQVRPSTPGAAEDGSKLTTPQRLDKMQAIKAERDAQMSRHIDAVKSFYATLSPEQQKVFDAQGHGHFQRAGMKSHHGMGAMGGKACDGPMQQRS